MSAVTPEQFRATMASFAAGVTVITTLDPNGLPRGLTATAFSSVTLEPPTCLVCVAHTAEAHPAVRHSGRFAVNILKEEQRAASTLFATTGADKFADVPWHPGPALGCPILEDCLAFLECEVAQTHRFGDHDVFFGIVASTGTLPGKPLTYFRGRYAGLVDF